jgi:hypothetical protein
MKELKDSIGFEDGHRSTMSNSVKPNEHHHATYSLAHSVPNFKGISKIFYPMVLNQGT